MVASYADMSTPCHVSATGIGRAGSILSVVMHKYLGNGTSESGNAESKKSFVGGAFGAKNAETACQMASLANSRLAFFFDVKSTPRTGDARSALGSGDCWGLLFLLGLINVSNWPFHKVIYWRGF